MKVGIPCEVKSQEYRVAITPSGVNELVRSGHRVYVERGAGKGSSIPDADFVAAGAEILPAADDVWATGELILKVKEPIPEEYGRMRKDQVLLDLPAPCRRQGMHRRIAGRGDDGDCVRDRATRGSVFAVVGAQITPSRWRPRMRTPTQPLLINCSSADSLMAQTRPTPEAE